MSNGYAVAVDESAYMPSRKSKKKSNFVKRWLYKWVSEEVDNQRLEEKMSAGSISIGPSNRIDSDKGIRFQVYKATGGFVVETSLYDRQRDRHHNSLHIITDDQDLGAQIGKIITMETLKA